MMYIKVPKLLPNEVAERAGKQVEQTEFEWFAIPLEDFSLCSTAWRCKPL
jgi:hypothetical protein